MKSSREAHIMKIFISTRYDENCSSNGNFLKIYFILTGDVIDDVLKAWLHIPIDLYTTKILFVWHWSLKVKSSGQINTHTNRLGETYLPITCDHDDVIKWKHFPRYYPTVWGIHGSPVNSQHKRQWRGALMFSLICVWINGWVNNHEAGDLRRYRVHYDVTVM